MSPFIITPVRVNPVHRHDAERGTLLKGEWRFRLDPEDRGRIERWYRQPDTIHEEIIVPGCWQGQGFGDDSMDFVWDFRLRARTFRATYKGTGWYARSFSLQDGGTTNRVHLRFGGVHPSAEVWLNGVRLGEHHLPFAPFGFDVTDSVRRRGQNDLVVRVFEDARPLGLAFSWQGNWSGLYRDVELVETGEAWIENLRLCGDLETEQLHCSVVVAGVIEPNTRLAINIRDEKDSVGRHIEHAVPISSHVTSFSVRVPSPSAWSPDTPCLYRVDAVLNRESGDRSDANTVLDALSERTGFVSLTVSGKHVLINDEPYYMRGTGEFLASPEVGSPDTDRSRLRKKLRQLREYGYNYVRFQSYVQAPEYFDVADEVGLLIQSEPGMLGGWGGHTEWHRYTWPEPTPEYRDVLRRHWSAVVLRDANHPSANLYCMSNELGRACLFPRTAWQCYHETKAVKPTALVIWTDGGWNSELPGDFVNDAAEVDAQTTLPVIQHEFQWWSSFPDISIVDKYSGAMRPYAQEIAIDAARRHGTEHVLELAARTSQQLQYIEAKGKMERCRMDHPTLAGICHFNAMDTTPSPQGIVDEFFEAKCTQAAEWLEVNGDTVLLCNLGFDQRVYSPGSTFRATLNVSDYSHPALESPKVTWRIVLDGNGIAHGSMSFTHEPYRTTAIGTVSCVLPNDCATPSRGVFAATITDGKRTFSNQWDIWVLPDVQTPINTAVKVGESFRTWLQRIDVPAVQQTDRNVITCPVILCEEFGSDAERFVRNGGWAIIAVGEGLVRPYPPKFGMKLGHYYFTPPANYPPYEDGHDGTIITDHPALDDLLHEGFADLQFFDLITDSPPIELEPLFLNDADPIIRVMHSYPVGRSLGYLVERRLGHGGVLLCALDLNPEYPAGRLLLTRLCEYAASGVSKAPVMSDEAVAVIRELSHVTSA